MINTGTYLLLVKKLSFRIIKILSVVFVVVLVVETVVTTSFLFDNEISNDNAFSASTLAIGMRSGQNNFVSGPLTMEPGDRVTRDVYVQKLGSSDMKYKSEFEMLAGSDSELCEALELRAYYNWYDALPSFPSYHQFRHMDLKYSGLLSNFTDFDTSPDPDMTLFNSHFYFNNLFYGANEHWFYYQVTLPSGVSASLQDMDCNFNIKTTAWQTDFTNDSLGFSHSADLEGNISTAIWAPEYLIALNEFIPDPVGSDDSLMPEGEWIELYNNGSVDFDVNNWVIYDSSDSNEIVISSSNSDNNGNHLDGGETIVPAGGRLVVYRNGDSDFALNNNGSGDSVRLYTDRINSGGVLIDSYVYTSTLEGKSYARIPDGVGAWVDPVPTPGWENTNEVGDLDPIVKVWQQDRENLRVGLLDMLNYDKAQVEILYNRDEEGSLIGELFTKDLGIDRNNLYLKDLFMGSVSGDNHYLHYGIEAIEVNVLLTGSGIPDRTIEVVYPDDWIYD